MSRAVVLVWLGAVTGRADHDPDLDSWAASRMVTLEDPAPEESLAPADHDDALSARIEALLAEARTAAYAADPTAAEAALESAELLLRGNPSLPEAAWLMAETCRDHAALVRPRDPELAAILDRRAATLDGARAAAFDSERAPATTATTATTTTTTTTTTMSGAATIASTETTLDGPLPDDEVDVDGVPMLAPRTIPGGEHHVRIRRRGQLAWAGWVTADAAQFRIPLPGVVPCSETDLARVSANGANAAAGVLCPEWAIARDLGSNRIEIARCHAGACDTFLPWSRGWGQELEGPMQPAWPREPSRTWIAWTAASVAALGLGAVVLWKEGAFDRQGPPHESYQFTAVPAPH